MVRASFLRKAARLMLRIALIDLLLFALPFVLYGIFRYLHLVYSRQDGEAPELVLTTDLPLLGCIFLWALAMMWAKGGH